MSPSDLFIKRPVLSTVLGLLILLLGMQGFFNLQIREYPKVDETVITITTVYPGAAPDLIQGFITSPVAQAARSCPSPRRPRPRPSRSTCNSGPIPMSP